MVLSIPLPLSADMERGPGRPCQQKCVIDSFNRYPTIGSESHCEIYAARTGSAPRQRKMALVGISARSTTQVTLPSAPIFFLIAAAVVGDFEDFVSEVFRLTLAREHTCCEIPDCWRSTFPKST
jgi:hypothetical protein